MFIPLHDTNKLDHVRIQYVTLAIILANCAIWLFFGTTLFVGESAVRATIVSYGFIPAVANGYEALPEAFQAAPAFAKYLTYSFLHADFMHLAGNMLFVWVFGDNVEDAMGHLKFALFYAACAIAGALLHSFVFPASEAPLIGASGAAAGIIAAYLLLHPNVKVWILALGRIPLRLSAIWVIGAWIGFQVFNFLFSVGDEVSWSAHVGGIAAGIILLPLLKRSDVPLFDRTPAEEVIPPVPPPHVAKKGHRLRGQPEEPKEEPDFARDKPAESSSGPWGRKAGGSTGRSSGRPWGRDK